jgi:hypothetical protein
LNEKERYWIKYYNSNYKVFGYNLDSGGCNGGKKSEETKRKISETTKIKWLNPETSKKMLAGLRKGNETQKSKPKKTKVLTCAYCGKEIVLSTWETNRRIYCSDQCATNAKTWQKGVDIAAKKNHENNIIHKKEIKKDIEKWVLQNKNLVLNCPKNKIRATLSSLINIINKKYEIKDFRSLFTCFDNVHNMKSFLIELQNIIPEENVC